LSAVCVSVSECRSLLWFRGGQSVVVKGLERNMASLYEARRLLLGLDSGEMAKVDQTTPDPALSANELTNYWLALLLQQLRLSERGE